MPARQGQVGGPVAGSESGRRKPTRRPLPRRLASWLAWWVVLMAFWVWADDTLLTAELIVGAIVAAIAALAAELAADQAASHIHIRAEWLVPALRLPLNVLRDTVTVLAALIRRMTTGKAPASTFTEKPVEPSRPRGADKQEEESRRAVAIGITSFAPNTFALGVDEERGVMVIHQLVPRDT